MIRYIETISVERSEAIPLAAYHLRRVRETLGEEPDFLRSEEQLLRLFRAHRPAEEAEQYKLRLVYSAAGIEEVSVTRPPCVSSATVSWSGREAAMRSRSSRSRYFRS